MTQLVETCVLPEPAELAEDDDQGTADDIGPGGYEHPWSRTIPHTYQTIRTTCQDFGFSNCNRCDSVGKVGTVASNRKDKTKRINLCGA